MNNIPIPARIVPTELSRIDKFKRSLIKHKTSIILGTALAASMTMNVLLSTQPPGTTRYFLTPDDVEYLNRLLEEDRQE